MNTSAAAPIIPFLWFNGTAEKAVALYTSLFSDSEVVRVMSFEGSEEHGTGGSAMTIEFKLRGQTYLALNGGPLFSFTPAVSFMVMCEDQSEVDHFWKGFTEGGQAQRCGWVQDAFGLSWQVVPRRFSELMADPDPARRQRVMAAMMEMTKFDIAALDEAAG